MSNQAVVTDLHTINPYESTIAADMPIPISTIDDLPVEILILIFQELIDTEALCAPERFPAHQYIVKAAFTLGLVNKKWRKVVNECSSLWRVLWIDACRSLEPTRRNSTASSPL
jgi:hypothetical protein